MAYTPASVLTSGNYPNLQAIHYERQAIPNLKAETPFLSMTKQKPLPMYSGNVIQFYTYALLGANVGQAAEGAVGSPITESTTKIQATIGQYADFINSSDLAMDVAIDDPGLLENLSRELTYRLSLTLNTLTQIATDTATAVDPTVNTQLAQGSFLTANNIRSMVQSLKAANVRTIKNDEFWGIMHPNVVRDVLNDTTLNGLTDIIKRGDQGKLFEVPKDGEAISFAGAKFKQTTTAPQVTISNNTYYNTYLYGDDALFSIFLGKAPEGDQNFKLKIQNAPEGGSVSDPARMLGGWISYNVRFTTSLPPGATMRIRRYQSMSATS